MAKNDDYKKFIDSMSKWAYNLDFQQFCVLIYDKKEEIDQLNYCERKWHTFRKNFWTWWGGLDEEHADMVVQLVVAYGDEIGEAIKKMMDDTNE